MQCAIDIAHFQRRIQLFEELKDLGATIVWLKELPAAAKLVSSVLEAPIGPWEAKRGLLLLGDSKSPL